MSKIDKLKQACAPWFEVAKAQNATNVRFAGEAQASIARLLKAAWGEFQNEGEVDRGKLMLSRMGEIVLHTKDINGCEGAISFTLDDPNGGAVLWTVNFINNTAEGFDLDSEEEAVCPECGEEIKEIEYDIDHFLNLLAEQVGSEDIAGRMVVLGHKYAFCTGKIREDWRGWFNDLADLEHFKRAHGLQGKNPPPYDRRKLEELFIRELGVSRGVAELYGLVLGNYLRSLGAPESGSPTFTLRDNEVPAGNSDKGLQQ